MLDAIKQAAKEAVDASKPVCVESGIVISVNPLKVNVEQRLTLEADFLIQTDATKELKLTIGDTEYIVRRGLQAGDKVILLRVQGGQQYVILDRQVSS